MMPLARFDRLTVFAQTETALLSSHPSHSVICDYGAINLARLGLDLADCVVPGIATAGGEIQFLAVYLLQPSFPVIIALSNQLSLQYHFAGRRTHRQCLGWVRQQRLSRIADQCGPGRLFHHGANERAHLDGACAVFDRLGDEFRFGFEK